MLLCAAYLTYSCFCVCSVHQNKAASDRLKISYFFPNRSSPRENSPKPCLNRATQSGNRLLWWALSQIPNWSVCFLSRSTYANIQRCTRTANGLMQTFHSLIFKSFALYMIGALYDQCHYWTQANIEQLLNVHKTLPKQSDVVLNVIYETKMARGAS